MLLINNDFFLFPRKCKGKVGTVKLYIKKEIVFLDRVPSMRQQCALVVGYGHFIASHPSGPTFDPTAESLV